MDIFEFPGFENMLGEDSVPSSPAKSKRNSLSLHRRSLSGSNGLSNGDHGNAYHKATRMFNLETLALGFDALEQFALVYDQISK